MWLVSVTCVCAKHARRVRDMCMHVCVDECVGERVAAWLLKLCLNGTSAPAAKGRAAAAVQYCTYARMTLHTPVADVAHTQYMTLHTPVADVAHTQ